MRRPRTACPPPDRMLDVAARLFATRRFHEVRMEDIATEADVGKGTLYRYFKDKDDLYLALLGRAAEQLIRRLHEAAGQATGPVERLEALIAAVIAFFDEQPHVLDLIQRAEAMSGSAANWQPARDEMSRLVFAQLAEGQAARAFTMTDPETTALLLLGGTRGVLRFGSRPRPADIARRIVRTVLFGAVEESNGTRTSYADLRTRITADQTQDRV